MVREMLKRGGVSVIVLGGDHDLSDNIKRLAPEACEYARVTIAEDGALVGDSENRR